MVFPIKAAKVLGVTRKNTEEEVRKKYLTLSQIWHPDKPTGNTQKFAEISDANDKLKEWFEKGNKDDSDDEGEEHFHPYEHPTNPSQSQRKKTKKRGFEKDSDGNTAWKSATSSSFDPNKKSKKQRPRSEDVTIELSFTLEEIYLGKKIHTHTIGPGKTISFKIEPSFKSGTTITFEGQSPKNKPDYEEGDLIFVIFIKSNNRFIKDDKDLHHVIDVTLYQACAKKPIFATTLDNRQVLVISDEIITNTTRRRIPGEGIPKGEGFLDVSFNILWPEDVDETTLACLKKLSYK